MGLVLALLRTLSHVRPVIASREWPWPRPSWHPETAAEVLLLDEDETAPNLVPEGCP